MINHTWLYAHMYSLNTECFQQLTAGRGIKVSSKYGIIMEATSGMQNTVYCKNFSATLKSLNASSTYIIYLVHRQTATYPSSIVVLQSIYRTKLVLHIR